MVTGSPTVKRALLPALATAVVVVLLGTALSSGAQEDGHEHEHPTTTAAPPPTTAKPTPTTAAPTPTSVAPTPTTAPAPPTSAAPPPTAPPTTLPPRSPGAQKTTIQYGPFTMPGMNGTETGAHAHASTGNQFSFLAQKPCSDCYITGMKADLVYPDGRQANQSTGAMLHHMVLWNFGNFDATCAVSIVGVLGERFFASGDERSPIELPAGYGYYTGALNPWNLVYELANTTTEAQSVIIEMEYEFVPAAAAGDIKPADPVWLDIVPCLFSQYAVPAGKSSTKWTWLVNRPGSIVSIGGHLHDGGVNIDIANDSTGEYLCNSVAKYGGPGYVSHHGTAHLSSMSGCVGSKERPIATINSGQSVSITANYDIAEAASDVMGIVIMYVARQ